MNKHLTGFFEKMKLLHHITHLVVILPRLVMFVMLSNK
jgi:hypothetical protein